VRPTPRWTRTGRRGRLGRPRAGGPRAAPAPPRPRPSPPPGATACRVTGAASP